MSERMCGLTPCSFVVDVRTHSGVTQFLPGDSPDGSRLLLMHHYLGRYFSLIQLMDTTLDQLLANGVQHAVHKRNRIVAGEAARKIECFINHDGRCNFFHH